MTDAGGQEAERAQHLRSVLLFFQELGAGHVAQRDEVGLTLVELDRHGGQLDPAHGLVSLQGPERRQLSVQVHAGRQLVDGAPHAGQLQQPPCDGVGLQHGAGRRIDDHASHGAVFEQAAIATLRLSRTKQRRLAVLESIGQPGVLPLQTLGQSRAHPQEEDQADAAHPEQSAAQDQPGDAGTLALDAELGQVLARPQTLQLGLLALQLHARAQLRVLGLEVGPPDAALQVQEALEREGRVVEALDAEVALDQHLLDVALQHPGPGPELAQRFFQVLDAAFDRAALQTDAAQLEQGAGETGAQPELATLLQRDLQLAHAFLGTPHRGQGEPDRGALGNDVIELPDRLRVLERRLRRLERRVQLAELAIDAGQVAQHRHAQVVVAQLGGDREGRFVGDPRFLVTAEVLVDDGQVVPAAHLEGPVAQLLGHAQRGLVQLGGTRVVPGAVGDAAGEREGVAETLRRSELVVERQRGLDGLARLLHAVEGVAADGLGGPRIPAQVAPLPLRGVLDPVLDGLQRLDEASLRRVLAIVQLVGDRPDVLLAGLLGLGDQLQTARHPSRGVLTRRLHKRCEAGSAFRHVEREARLERGRGFLGKRGRQHSRQPTQEERRRASEEKQHSIERLRSLHVQGRSRIRQGEGPLACPP